MLTISEILKAVNGKLISKGTKGSISGISTDTRTIKEGDVFIAIKGKNFDGHNFIKEAVKKGACGVIVQSAICPSGPSTLSRHSPRDEGNLPSAIWDKIALIQVKDTLKALGDIANYHRRQFRIPFIGITGSNGKTTTKEIIYRILSSRFCVLKNEGTENNLIGLPQALLCLNARHNIGVLELGTNHFGEIRRLAQVLKPDIGIITNISPAHLEFFKSTAGVFKEKAELLRALGKNDTAVINADDALLGKIKKLKCRIVKFGIDNGCDFKITRILRQDTETQIILNNKHDFKFKLLGRHNIYNALAAITAGFLYKIDYDDIHKALLGFRAVSGRACLKRIEGLDIIDDTYNSNPGSLKAAVAMLSDYKTPGRKILVCGDMLELGDLSVEFHKEAAGAISQAHIDYLISVGKFSEVIKEAAVLNGMREDTVISCKDNQTVLAMLKKIIREGDVILLKGSRFIKLDEVADALLSFISATRDMVRI